MFRDALRALLVTTLRCVRCGAANRRGATVIEIDETSTRAYCAVCAVEGPIASFQPKKKET